MLTLMFLIAPAAVNVGRWISRTVFGGETSDPCNTAAYRVDTREHMAVATDAAGPRTAAEVNAVACQRSTDHFDESVGYRIRMGNDDYMLVPSPFTCPNCCHEYYT